MIKHKTLSRKTGLSRKSIQENHELMRSEAESFIKNQLSDDQVISITESAVMMPLGMTWTIVSATVWYKDERGG